MVFALWRSCFRWIFGRFFCPFPLPFNFLLCNFLLPSFRLPDFLFVFLYICSALIGFFCFLDFSLLLFRSVYLLFARSIFGSLLTLGLFRQGIVLVCRLFFTGND